MLGVGALVIGGLGVGVLALAAVGGGAAWYYYASGAIDLDAWTQSATDAMGTTEAPPTEAVVEEEVLPVEPAADPAVVEAPVIEPTPAEGAADVVEEAAPVPVPAPASAPRPTTVRRPVPVPPPAAPEPVPPPPAPVAPVVADEQNLDDIEVPVRPEEDEKKGKKKK